MMKYVTGSIFAASVASLSFVYGMGIGESPELIDAEKPTVAIESHYAPQPTHGSEVFSLEDIIEDAPKPTGNQDKPYLAELPSREGDGYIRHPVERGETLWGIANGYAGIEIDEIREANGGLARLDYADIITIPKRSDDSIDSMRYEDMDRSQREEFLRNRSSPGSHEYISDILEISENNGIDARIPLAIASAESGFDNGAVSSMGAQTMWQLIPKYHGHFEDPMEALPVALGFFNSIYERFMDIHDDETSALISSIAAYNVGPNRVRGWIENGQWDGRTVEGIPRNGHQGIGFSNETRNYVDRVVNETMVDLYNYNL